MLTQPIISGLNLLALAGFILMGLGLTFSRQKRIGAPVAIALMGVGTVLVFIGIYAAAPASTP